MNHYIKKVVREPVEIIDFIISYWPGARGRMLRAWSLAKKLRTIGVNPSIDIGVVITGGGRIRIGDYFAIMRYSASMGLSDQLDHPEIVAAFKKSNKQDWNLASRVVFMLLSRTQHN